MLVGAKPRKPRNSLFTRLEDIRKLRGLSRAELAKRVGVSEVSITRYTNEPQRLSLPMLVELAKALSCSVSQIIGEAPLETARLHDVCFYERIEMLDQVYVVLPLAKDRRFAWEMVANLKGKTVAPKFGARLARLTPGREPENLVVLDMPDDSMAPTLLPGEELLIEAAAAVRADGVYALRFGDDLAIKRLQFHPITRRLKISSDNTDYAAYDDIDPKQVDVVGFMVRR